eukprot:bmy_13244T0
MNRGWDTDGKGPCVWDTFTHQGRDRVFKNQTGDVACGSYTLWEEDLKCIKQLGLTHYRFSLSWSRLLPDGTTGFINQKGKCFLKIEGIDYYNKIIDDLLTIGVTPIVTLYHFDLPQALEDQGGWLSEAIVESFDKYARFCFSTFGDRVKQWITINEPNIFALLAYECGAFSPGVPYLMPDPGTAMNPYSEKSRKEWCLSQFLLAGWNQQIPTQCLTRKQLKAMAFQLDFFAKPIFIDGDYPEVVKSQVALMSKKQGYPSSRLPEFTEEEKKMIKGTADFFAYQENKKGELGLLQNAEVEVFPDPSCISLDWVYVVPWGIRKLLKYIKDMYNNPVIYITENGFPQGDPTSFDDALR